MFALVLALPLLYVLARGVIVGWRYSLRLPGGLEGALSESTTYRLGRDLFIAEHEHYERVTVTYMWIVVWTTRNTYVSIPRFTRAYDTVSYYYHAAPPWQELHPHDFV